MKFTVERNWIDVLGHIWMPNCQAALCIDLTARDIAAIKSRKGTLRQKTLDWLTTHSGDFQAVDDFHAIIGPREIKWQSEESEMQFNDCMYPIED